MPREALTGRCGWSCPHNCRNFREADRAEFGEAHAEIAKEKGEVGIFGIELGEKPGSTAPGAKQLDDGHEIDWFGERGLFAARIAAGP
jgi:hypothetical protein